MLDANPLDTQADLEAAVAEQLARIHRRPQELRINTAKAIIAAATNPTTSVNAVFGTDGVVTQATFYNMKKDWIHDPLYREVLEVCIALHRHWDATAAVRERNKQREDWQKRMYGLSTQTADMVEEMLKNGLHERYEYDDNGTPVIIMKPKYSPRDIATLLPAADKVARMALEMHTDSTAVDVKAEVADVDLDQIRKSMSDKLTKTRANLLQQAQAQAQQGGADEDDDE